MTARIIIILSATGLLACTSAAKKAELDRQNIFFAEFYHEQGFPGRSVEHAKKIKPGSPHYAAAQEWIERATYEEDDLGLPE